MITVVRTEVLQRLKCFRRHENVFLQKKKIIAFFFFFFVSAKVLKTFHKFYIEEVSIW